MNVHILSEILFLILMYIMFADEKIEKQISFDYI